MSRQKVCFLITCVGGTLVPAALRMLRESKRFDYRLVGVNATPAPLAAQFLDAFHTAPKGDDPAYAQALLDIVRKEKVEVLLPWSDAEAEAMSALAGELAGLGGKALVASPACLARIANKRVTYDNLRAAGLPAPEYAAVHDASSLRAAVAAYGHPGRTVVVKPSRGRGGRGLFVLLGHDNPPEWLGAGQREKRLSPGELDDARVESFFSFGGELLVMPCLGVPAFDADVVGLGREPAVLVRRRHNPTGIPFAGNTLVADPEVVDYCRTVARVLGLEAVHDIDLMASPEGRPVVLEVNPRPSGSLPASMAAGFPVLDWAVDRALGGDPEVGGPDRDLDVMAMVVPQPVDPAQGR
ncbi:MAG: ATP-grasp domain-containing protein [Thermodesulfobacteriota bacterium]